VSQSRSEPGTSRTQIGNVTVSAMSLTVLHSFLHLNPSVFGDPSYAGPLSPRHGAPSGCRQGTASNMEDSCEYME
jgi:hypothetical protein